MSYSMPSFYDILPNDYLHTTYTNQANSRADLGFEGPCFFPTTDVDLAPAYPMYNGLPFFQTPPSFPSTSSSSTGSSTSWDSSWSQSSGSPPSNNLSSQPTLEPETKKRKVKTAIAKLGKRTRRCNSVRRIEGQIKRPACMGNSAVFKNLPEAVQRHLVKFYDCCEKIDKNDKGTLTKHRLCTEHFTKAVGNRALLLDMQPVCTCPAFLSMDSLCRNAKGGRSDSSNRHFKICAGFKTMRAKCQKSGMAITPVQITRGEFNAVQEFRRNMRPGQQTYPEPVLNAVFKLLAMMATGETVSGAIEVSEPGSESSDEHAGVIAPDDDVTLSFSSQKSGNDGTDGVSYMPQF